MQTKKKPRYSVIIPVSKLSDTFLTETLPQLQQQVEHSFECIVLPDKRSKLDRMLLKTYPWLRIMPTYTVKKPAMKRNIGAKKAHGAILAFIDDDAYPDPYWLKRAGDIVHRKGIGAAGGPGIVPKQATQTEYVIDVVLQSPLGSGEYGYRFIKKKSRYVDDYPAMNFFIQKKIFATIGGFQTNYWPGEDSKLCEVLLNRNLSIFYSPRIVVYHHRRREIGGFLKQHIRYGYHRGLFFGHGDRNSRKIGYAVPSFVVMWIVLTIVGITVTRQYPVYPYVLLFFLIGIYGYAAALTTHIIYAIRQKTSIIVSLQSAILMLMLHVTYGTAFLWGIFQNIFPRYTKR